MTISFTETAWDDYLYWQKSDRNTLKRVNMLLRDIQRSPFEGIGQPEALRFGLAGCWSRRINLEHRLVYSVAGEVVTVLQCRYHY